MTQHERAAQLWSLLVLAARTQQVLSYGMVERLTGIPRQGVGNFLGPIEHYCKRHKLPPLSSLVVNEQKGLPSAGFTKTIDAVGAQVQVFAFDWFSHETPSPQDFRI
jgi:hypothetical protein